MCPALFFLAHTVYMQIWPARLQLQNHDSVTTLHSSPADMCRIAPEFLVGGRIGSAADVYSMGESVRCAMQPAGAP